MTEGHQPSSRQSESSDEFAPRHRPESEVSLGGTDGEAQLEARLEQTLHELASCLADAQRIVDLGKENYINDWLTQRAAKNVVTEFAETVNRIPASFKSEHPSVPWRAINGMHNRIVHINQHADPMIVWEALAVDFPRVQFELNLP